ncbi:protein of unknown function DUF829 containing protein [Nitzschia inconspicua]|uniref:Uncharacterized protein n=1 Tax=Nitzschia inconspicua TaxID=303405 RepID=A0A9K3LY97_9STRA|nr:protein of unknown function DUF829 containing protein [Nitzschia inconspicua]
MAAKSPPLDFFLSQHGRLHHVAKAVLQETESLLTQINSETQRKDNDIRTTVPIVVHMWSNGGTFLWEQLQKEKIFHQRVKPNLQAVVFDSCPCYLHMPWNLGPFWNDAFPFPGWTSWGRKLYLLAASTNLGLWCLLTGSLQRSEKFWTAMQKRPVTT